MAAGMHAVASGQLGTAYAPPSTEGGGTEPQSAPPAVEIVVLSEEQSQEAKAILQERSRASRPSMAKYGQMLHCAENAADGSKLNRRLARENQSGSLMRRALDGMPVLGLVPTMSWTTLRADLIAGLTVGVMVIPQSMSYASIAGLPYIYGMYAACVPTFVYAFLGQSRQLAVGPVAMVSLLIEAGLTGLLSEEECPTSYKNGKLDPSIHQYEECPEQYVRLAVLAAAVVGVMQILARLLKLGFLVSFLGHPVTSGFTSGAAIIIGTSQLKYILGFNIAKSEFFYITIWNIIQSINKTKWMTVLLGLSWLAFLIASKRLARQGGKLALIGPLGPLISCVAGSLLMLACTPLRDDFHVKYVGEIPSGIFPVSVNHWDFGSVFKVLPTALSVCLIGYMESIAIGKNLAAKHGHEIEAGQELFALGVSNLIGSMFSCYPVTGSFSRSAVANATGALTQVLVPAMSGRVQLLWQAELALHTRKRWRPSMREFKKMVALVAKEGLHSSVTDIFHAVRRRCPEWAVTPHRVRKAAWAVQRRGGVGLQLATAFAGGALLSAGLVHLLADAAKDFAENAGEEAYPWPELLCGLGCLITHGFESAAEALWPDHACSVVDEPTAKVAPSVLGRVADRDDPDHVGSLKADVVDSPPEDAPLQTVVRRSVDAPGPPDAATATRAAAVAALAAKRALRRSYIAGPLLTVALSFHSLLEGLGLGAAGAGRELDLFIAILVHKGVAAFSLGITWQAAAPSPWRYAAAMAWFASVTPAGIALGTPMEGSIMGVHVTALSAGAFLYIGVVEACPGVRAPWLPGTAAALQLAAFAGGFACMALLGMWT